MFRKTKLKIIILLSVSLILLLAATFAALVISEKTHYLRQNREMLSNYISTYDLQRHIHGERIVESGISPDDFPKSDSPEGQREYFIPDSEMSSDAQSDPRPALIPGERQDDPGKGPGDPRNMRWDGQLFNLSSFYSVAFSKDLEILAVDTGSRGIYTETELSETALGIIKSGKESGSKGTLYYIKSEKDGYSLLAFIDTTLNNSSLRSLTRHTLIVGVAALTVLLLISVFISNIIVKPLEENDLMQKQFVSDAGHELKTPISVISANSELLARQIGPNEWLDNIKYENERMGSLVIDLLDLSRAENPQSAMEPTDLSHLVLGELLAFESIAFENGMKIQSDIENCITVNSNRVQMSQLVHILLDNALRHSNGGSEIEVELKKHNRHAVLDVTNSGKAIPPDKMEHLFERFYRLDESRCGDGNHYGLGLAIAKAIVNRHGGTITVDCKDEKITFTVNLPL